MLARHVDSASLDDQVQNKSDPTFEKVVQPFFAKNCFACHDEDLQTADLNLGAFKTADSLQGDRVTMKLIFDKLKAGKMPPPKMPRPNPEELAAVTDWLAQQLAVPLAKSANPSIAVPVADHVTVRRLNRAEYDNTVRDLLGVDLHLANTFPQDDSGYGFDNIGDVLSLSPVLMEKYLSAAEKISRTAIFGGTTTKPTLVPLRSSDRKQTPELNPRFEYDLTGLSLTNAIHITYNFPVSADYVFRINLGGERPPGSAPFQVAVWIDGTQMQVVQVDPASLASFARAGEPQQLWSIKPELKVKVNAGVHWIAVSIPHLYEGLPASYKGPNPSTLPVPPRPRFKAPPDVTPKQAEDLQRQFEKRLSEKVPANGARIASIELGGPYDAVNEPSLDTRKKIYACGHLNGHHEKKCGRLIIARLAHRAYRRPISAGESNHLNDLMSQVQKDGGSFEEGLSVAVQAILISPQFLFRIERGRPLPPLFKGPAQLTQHELASRLSYFLWSSMPDDLLLAAADRGTLLHPKVLAAQVKRMLVDPRASAFVENFGGQWLQVRKLESVKPDRKKFPDFDEYLRLSMAKETEMFFGNLLHEDRSVLEFIDADYSFLNERLARFYGLTDVHGPEFRKVVFASDAHRGGLLCQASVLTISSYANRTSPVLRGKWVLENFVGSPPPPPPPDVPNLDESKIGRTSSMREQLEEHRKNAVCASCHSRMDPLGFGLENFDATGAWRTKEGEFLINASGMLPDGRSFAGPQGLKSILKAQPEAFTETLTRKMLIYALGRGLEKSDDDAVKGIVAKVAKDDYHISSLISGIVTSDLFQKRRGDSAR